MKNWKATEINNLISVCTQFSTVLKAFPNTLKMYASRMHVMDASLTFGASTLFVRECSLPSTTYTPTHLSLAVNKTRTLMPPDSDRFLKRNCWNSFALQLTVY